MFNLLDKIAKGFAEHGLDLSKLISLWEYLSDETVIKKIDNTSFDELDRELLEKFMPFLEDESRRNIFAKVLSGELDYTYLELITPYMDMYYLLPQIEAAVMQGVIDEEALKLDLKWK